MNAPDALTDDDRYAALVRRDATHAGRWFVGVRTTGIFCRPGCPARPPLRENCTFHPSAAACLEAGYRPCKRCRPLDAPAQTEAVVAALLDELTADPTRRWTEADLRARGHDPSTVRRAFVRQYGLSFVRLARLMRLRSGFETLSRGQPVIRAQLDAGFDSASGFRAAFARLLGVAPGTLRVHAPLLAHWVDTPLGPMVAVADAQALHLLEFADRPALAGELQRLARRAGPVGVGRLAPHAQIGAELADYFAGRGAHFSTPLALHGTPFTRAVWAVLRTIPPGHTRSYAQVARAVGRPTAVRAVARANGANQIAIVVPCHRVIGSDGALAGYGGGVWRKRQLIELEHHYAAAGQTPGALR